MKLSLDALAGHLSAHLAPIYLVSGDEPLLVGEALDAIRARSRALGFAERQVFFFERGNASWDPVLQAAQSLSLFAERRIVEVRLPSGKPGASGAAALSRIIQAADQDLLLLIVTERLDRDTQDAEWVRAVVAHGVWLPIWPVDRSRLPQWLRGRLSRAGLTASAQALELLAERSEGNLLAAQQEIDKLALLLPSGTSASVTDIIASSTDSARFDVFQLAEAVRAGDAGRSLRILGILRAEGSEPTLVLWALLRELHSATRSEVTSARLIARASHADRVAKGLAAGDAWDELVWLTAELSGVAPVAPLPPALSS